MSAYLSEYQKGVLTQLKEINKSLKNIGLAIKNTSKYNESEKLKTKLENRYKNNADVISPLTVSNTEDKPVYFYCPRCDVKYALEEFSTFSGGVKVGICPECGSCIHETYRE